MSYRKWMGILALSSTAAVSAQANSDKPFAYIGVLGGYYDQGSLAVDARELNMDSEYSFGAKALYMLPSQSVSWGLKVSYSQADFGTIFSDDTVDIDYKTERLGIALLAGRIVDNDDGSRQLLYIGPEYLNNKAKLECSGPLAFACTPLDLDGSAASVTAGFIYSAESGLAGGLGGRYIFAEGDGQAWEAYLTIGYSF